MISFREADILERLEGKQPKDFIITYVRTDQSYHSNNKIFFRYKFNKTLSHPLSKIDFRIPDIGVHYEKDGDDYILNGFEVFENRLKEQINEQRIEYKIEKTSFDPYGASVPFRVEIRGTYNDIV